MLCFDYVSHTLCVHACVMNNWRVHAVINEHKQCLLRPGRRGPLVMETAERTCRHGPPGPPGHGRPSNSSHCP